MIEKLFHTKQFQKQESQLKVEIKDQQIVQQNKDKKLEDSGSIAQVLDHQNHVVDVDPQEEDQSLRINCDLNVSNQTFDKYIKNSKLSLEDQILLNENYKKVKPEQHSFFLKKSDKLHKQFSVLDIFPFGCVIINRFSQVLYQNSRLQKLFGTDDENEILGHVTRIISGAEVKKKKNISMIKIGSVCSIDESQFNKMKNTLSNINLLDSLLKISHQVQDQNSKQKIKNYHIIRNESQFQGFQQLFNLEFEREHFKIKVFNNFSNSEYQEQQNLILIIIKDNSKKASLIKFRKQHIFQNQLLQSFSHELRTPLNCSIQSIQAVIPVQQDSSMKSLLKAALGSNFLLLHQINDILDSAAIESRNFKYQWTYFTFQDIIDEIQDMYSESFLIKGLKFVQQIEQNDLRASVQNDKGRIMQILVNLLNNSIKYTAQDGKLQLSIERINDSYQKTFKISISDNGVGINYESLERIKQALDNEIAVSPLINSSKKFIGLGLSNSHRLALGLSKYDKSFQINSRGKGTTVSFYVDDIISFGTSSNKSQSSKNYSGTFHFQSSQTLFFQDIVIPKLNLCFDRLNIQKQLTNNSKQSLLTSLQDISKSQSFIMCVQKCSPILIVDDIPFNHLALKAMLSSFGLSCDSVYDGEQAVQKVNERTQQHCKVYNLILMDIQMPKMNGFQATRQIRQFLKENQLDTTILMCSAFDTQENIDEAYESQMDGFLFKPIRINNLKIVLQKQKLIQS